MIVERCVTLRDALQFVVEVDDNFAQRHVELKFNAVARDEILLYQFAALAQTQSHDRTDVSGCGYDRCLNVRLFDAVDERNVGHSGRVVYFLALAVLVVNHVRYVWHGGYHVHVEFAVESLLNNLHV